MINLKTSCFSCSWQHVHFPFTYHKLKSCLEGLLKDVSSPSGLLVVCPFPPNLSLRFYLIFVLSSRFSLGLF